MLQRERLRVFGDSGSRLVGLRGNVLCELISAALVCRTLHTTSEHVKLA